MSILFARFSFASFSFASISTLLPRFVVAAVLRGALVLLIVMTMVVFPLFAAICLALSSLVRADFHLRKDLNSLLAPGGGDHSLLTPEAKKDRILKLVRVDDSLVEALILYTLTFLYS